MENVKLDPQYMAFESDFYKVSNAIRAKGGPEEPMAFPDGFVYAIENIPTGGGASEFASVPVYYVQQYNAETSVVEEV